MKQAFFQRRLLHCRSKSRGISAGSREISTVGQTANPPVLRKHTAKLKRCVLCGETGCIQANQDSSTLMLGLFYEQIKVTGETFRSGRHFKSALQFHYNWNHNELTAVCMESYAPQPPLAGNAAKMVEIYDQLISNGGRKWTVTNLHQFSGPPYRTALQPVGVWRRRRAGTRRNKWRPSLVVTGVQDLTDRN